MSSSSSRTPLKGNVALSTFVALGLGIGVITGEGEILVRHLRRLRSGLFSMLGEDALWMTLLANPATFTTIGIGVSLVMRSRPDRAPQVFITVYAFVAAFAILLMYSPLHPIARIALAAGSACSSAG